MVVPRISHVRNPPDQRFHPLLLLCDQATDGKRHTMRLHSHFRQPVGLLIAERIDWRPPGPPLIQLLYNVGQPVRLQHADLL